MVPRSAYSPPPRPLSGLGALAALEQATARKAEASVASCVEGGPEVDFPWPLGPALLGPILLLPAPRAPSLELPYPQTSGSGAQGFNLAVHPYMPQNTAI